MMKGQLKVNQFAGERIQKQKQREIRPIKQPVKQHRPPILLDRLTKHEDINFRAGDKDPRLKQAVVTEDHILNNKEAICGNLLEQGYVQSFIDLFYISHKCLPNVMDRRNYFGEQLHIPEPTVDEESTVQFYSDFAQSLRKAEVRQDSLPEQKEVSMSEYNSIAFNYEDQGDFLTASYFYQKVIELAITCKNQQFELVALLGLGKCHDQSGKTDQAIEILESGFNSACSLANLQLKGEMMKLIGKELIEIYIEKAEKIIKFDLEESLVAYENGLKVARRAEELDSEARISHKIGELYYNEGKFERSVEYQKQYLEKLKQSIETELVREIEEGEKKEGHNSLKFKEMQAHASLAKCYLKLKRIEEAEEHLNEYHRMAKEAKAQNSLADSSYYLAKLFEEKGDKEKAISYYQSYFEAAKSEKQDKKNRKLVDKARVAYAIAKANRNMTKYISQFDGENSLKALLDWKIKKVLK